MEDVSGMMDCLLTYILKCLDGEIVFNKVPIKSHFVCFILRVACVAVLMQNSSVRPLHLQSRAPAIVRVLAAFFRKSGIFTEILLSRIDVRKERERDRHDR